MDHIRTVVTENSQWKIDTVLRRYLRLPRHEGPATGTIIPYTAEWEPFTAIERHGDRLLVHRPVPMGTGALRMTGPVVEDDLRPEDFDQQ